MALGGHWEFGIYIDVLFEFRLKFWNTASIAQQNGTTARWYSNKTSLQSPFKVVLK